LSLKIVLLGDLHLVSPQDPYHERRSRRRHFADAWPFFHRIVEWVRDEAPDLVISVGDLVDWYSDENRDFAIQLMQELQTPWVMTPGNHDFLLVNARGDKCNADERVSGIRSRWEQSDVALGNRVMDMGRIRIILVDSHESSVSADTHEWLGRVTQTDAANVLVTHVPLNIPEVVDFILSVDSEKDLEKYVLTGAPRLYEQCVASRVHSVFTGHLHFDGYLELDQTRLFFLPLSICAARKKYRGQGHIAVMNTDDLSVYMRGQS